MNRREREKTSPIWNKRKAVNIDTSTLERLQQQQKKQLLGHSLCGNVRVSTKKQVNENICAGN